MARLLWLFALAVLLPANSPPNPAAAFGTRESASHLDISPSGRFVVYIAPAAGTSSAALVADLEGARQAVPILRSTGRPDRLQWCRFVNDTRLVCSVTALVEVAGELIPFSRLIAVNSDGSNIKQLGQRPSFEEARIRQFDGAIIDWLPENGRAVLMSRDYVPAGSATGTRMGRVADGLGVDRVNVETLRSNQVEAPTGQASGYITDGRGVVRIMEVARLSGPDTQLTSRTDYLYRLQGSDAWRPFGSFDSRTNEGMVPLAIDADLNAAYVLKKLNGRFAVYRVRLDESLTEELVYANPVVDVDNVVRIGRGGKVIGVTFAEEKREIVWFDREYAGLARSLSRALPGLPIISFIGSNRDQSKLLIFAGSDTDPGRYYVYEKSSRNLQEIMLARPELEGVTLASVRAVSYPASDGASVPGYLTLPPGREARNLPAVILPHGGPGARDEWGFDWLAQYLANQGYAVLQPNFRGSAGYGDEWFAQNGFRGWATSIGDVTAGARWLVAQGIADPGRMAILGWSYGGYAALQSGVTEPGLFKAIVAIAPVADLALLTEQARYFTSYRLLREFVGTGPHVEQGSPLRNVQRISAPVLLVHGTRDLNVDVRHSQQMHRALQSAGKSSELILFDGLEHDLGDSQARTRMLERIGSFLATALGR